MPDFEDRYDLFCVFLFQLPFFAPNPLLSQWQTSPTLLDPSMVTIHPTTTLPFMFCKSLEISTLLYRLALYGL